MNDFLVISHWPVKTHRIKRPWPEENRNFYYRTTKLEVALKITGMQLADRLGISRSTFSSSRSGARPVSHRTWARLRHLETETERAAIRALPPRHR